MNKSLEALKSLGEHHCFLMQKCKSEECNIPCYECKYFKKEKFIEKELKALEIFKNKKVWIAYLLKCDTCEDYNHGIYDFGKENYLTQEECDLLIEMLRYE